MKNNHETVEKKITRSDIVIKNIEYFIETKNRYIQVILLLFVISSEVAYNFVSEEMQTFVRYTLVLNIFMELFVLQTKDSIMQNKINRIGMDVNTQNGGMRFEEYVNIDNYFESANKDFYISGIAPSRFIQKYQRNIEDLLVNNKSIKVYMLVGSLESVPENCAEYYGTMDNKMNQYDLLSKLSVVVNAIENSDILKKALKEKRFLLATSNIVFASSYVGYDIFHFRSYHSKIKITFYQQGEHQAGKLPCFSIDSGRDIRDMYPYFQNIIRNQWKMANAISGTDELADFSDKLLSQLNQCKNKE